jgi:hypothetical protein
MSPNPMRCTLFGGVAVALAVLASPAVNAAEPTDAMQDAAPVVVAQASNAASARAASGAVTADAFPAYQRGVRQAAAESNQALRRYIWRTRMIYNFYYDDFAPKE